MPLKRQGALLLGAVAALTLSVAAACGGDSAVSIAVAQSNTPRNNDPPVRATELAPLVDGNTAFALDLYRELGAEDGNLFLSPYSISVALAMTYAGAAGDTASEMASVLGFSLAGDQLHPSFNRLSLELESRKDVQVEDGQDPFELSIANALWAERTYRFRPEYLDVIAANYGAGVNLVDFINQTEESRKTINAWVSDRTNDRIPQLIPPDVITSLTRLVLTNAIYFKASWSFPFGEGLTSPGDFHRLDGSTVTADMMRFDSAKMLPYARTAGLQAVELPYVGHDLAMLLLLPDEGTFEVFDAGLSAARLASIIDALAARQVSVILPKFEFESEASLKDALTAMGMPTAFEPNVADLSGMDGTRELFIQDVIHKAFVSVDESGTEAAAATAVVVGVTSAPLDPTVFEADRPFVFLIRDRETGAILFIGRVLDPTA